MANRYETIEILRTELGKRYKKTIRYPKMVKQSDDMYIISIQGDRLDNLAFKYYDPNGELKHLEHSPKYGKVSSRTHFRVDDI